MATFAYMLPLIACSALFTPLLPAQEDDAKPVPVTMAQALKLGPEKLTEHTNSSEAGQDYAAILYAIAKRIETEQAIAAKDLAQVSELDAWRNAIAECRQSAFGMAYIINGGGTMYSHGGIRDVASLEDFLSGFASRLPLAEGNGDPKATKDIDDAIAILKTLKPMDFGDPADDNEARKNLADETKRATGHWTNLKSMIAGIPAADAKAIAAFATGTLSWLKEEE